MLRVVFNRDLSLLWIANLLLLATYTTHGVLAPLWIQELGFREGTNGFILGLTSLGLLAGLLTLGTRIDASDPRIYIALGSLVWAFTSALLYFFPNIAVMGLCRFVQGTGYAAFYTASLVFATRSVPQQRRGAVIGMIEAVGAFTIALTPLAAYKILSLYGFSMTIMVSGIPALLAGMIALSIRSNPELCRDKDTLFASRPLNLKAVLPGMIGATLFFVAVAYVNLLPLIAKQLHVSNIGLYFAARAMATVPTRILSGIIADKKNPLYAIIPGYLLSLLAMACLPVLLAPGWNYLIPIVFGLGMGLASPALVHWMLHDVPAQAHATAYNTYTIFTEGSGFFGSWMLGISLQVGSLSAFWMLAGLIGLGLIAFIHIQVKQQTNVFITD
jgi:MFS family permease